jgi:hypothetical protein
MLPISCQIAANLLEGEFVSERPPESKKLAFTDLDGDDLRDKVVVDEKFAEMKALLRIYWGDRRGRANLGSRLFVMVNPKETPSLSCRLGWGRAKGNRFFHGCPQLSLGTESMGV